MKLDVKIPAIGESITGGLLANWRIKDGDVVAQGQPLFDFETDKITSEATADASGKISIKVAGGTEVTVGQVVATIDTAAAEAPGAVKPSAPDAEPASAKIAPPLSPAAMRVASETGVDPATVTGTGKGGRVTKADLLAAAVTPAAKEAPTPSPASPSSIPPVAPAPGAGATRRKMSPLRRKIAERLVQAKSETAMLTTFNEVNMAPVMELRKKYQDDFVKKHGIKLGFMSFFVKAVVHALKEVPQVNAQIDGDEIIENNCYDVGVAVGTEKGLIVPVVRGCDKKGFAQIERDIAEYAKKARDGRIQIADLQGGVFTITNGGIYGSMLSTPIMNHPQAAILGMHNIVERPWVENGQIVVRPIMYLAVSYDHRLIDGKEAVTFLVRIKQAIEDPARLLFEM
ncbi:MAG: 2-oxoglutarate dehydrogenase complex dihydrolipoyllysine-residue succinyltransferase [Puniceicoccales bacterium]|jgi:2-oxoglutarate dehydrogenase E2 component (dihydrolipoamide succinyltransferase)|nr:2-oxoglutarate dehydrogenase complex dihydrolipoyllysine-residue succinyltransferase [Puniceicoccales bacterium]